MGTDSTVKCAKQGYVIGFMFSEDAKQVALIRKEKPAWQKGKLNGIGGKLEPKEAPSDAMVREFLEETGFETSVNDWSYFARLDGGNGTEKGTGFFMIHCFVSVGELSLLKSMEDEAIEIVALKDISSFAPDEILDNTQWLVSLAHDHLDDGRPLFVSVDYP